MQGRLAQLCWARQLIKCIGPFDLCSNDDSSDLPVCLLLVCPCPADVSGKLYSPSAYYVAKQLAVLPFAVLNSLLFAFTLYGLAGLRHSAVAVGVNGLMSVLIYLIAAQVRTHWVGFWEWMAWCVVV